MRKLIVLRGAPGSGKSTWVKNNHFDNYTLSTDKIRFMVGSSEFLIDSESYSPAPKANKRIWNILFDILQTRMENGEFTIVDATHTRSSEIRKYKDLAKRYKYDVYCVDFSDVSEEVCKERNRARDITAVVPDFVVEKFSDRLKVSEIPEGVKVLKPDVNLVDYFYAATTTAVSSEKYKKIMFLGDIHGCYNALMKALDGGIKDDVFYVFCGDYLDRGPHNAEVMNFLFDNMNKENVIFIEGNHEKHIFNWANGYPIRSVQFAEVTAKELSAASCSTKKAIRFCNSLKEFANITYNNRHIFACHGGIADFMFGDIKNCLFMNSNTFIKGHGSYEESDKMSKIFEKRQPDIIQVHGHRNLAGVPIEESKNVKNLEGAVEKDGYLRVFEIDADGNENSKYFKED